MNSFGNMTANSASECSLLWGIQFNSRIVRYPLLYIIKFSELIFYIYIYIYLSHPFPPYLVLTIQNLNTRFGNSSRYYLLVSIVDNLQLLTFLSFFSLSFSLFFYIYILPTTESGKNVHDFSSNSEGYRYHMVWRENGKPSTGPTVWKVLLYQQYNFSIPNNVTQNVSWNCFG